MKCMLTISWPWVSIQALTTQSGTANVGCPLWSCQIIEHTQTLNWELHRCSAKRTIVFKFIKTSNFVWIVFSWMAVNTENIWLWCSEFHRVCYFNVSSTPLLRKTKIMMLWRDFRHIPNQLRGVTPVKTVAFWQKCEVKGFISCQQP